MVLFESVALVCWSVITSKRMQRHLVLSGDFEVFRPAGVTRCTDWGDIRRAGVDRTSPCQISPTLVQHVARGPKQQILINFYQISKQKRVTLVHLLHDFS